PAVSTETPRAEGMGVTDTPVFTIEFNASETVVPLSKKSQLDALARQLKSDDALRVTLVAFASRTTDQASTSRKVALSRALSVRAYLIDQGVQNLRINVLSKGDQNTGGADDRVDVFIQNMAN